jgi:hypothetical protein
MHLTNWKARRAGGRITINGTDELGRAAKIVGVDVIEPTGTGKPPWLKATDMRNFEHTLAV